MELTKKQKNTMIGLSILLLIALLYVIWKVFFEFDNTAVSNQVQTRLADSDNPTADNVIIQDGMKHILASTFLTQQVKDYAKMNNVPKEQVLVNAAVAQAQANGYL